MCECAALMLTQNRCEPNDFGMSGMCGHNQIGIWEISKITVVDSNDVVNHWLMTGVINIPTILINDRCL